MSSSKIPVPFHSSLADKKTKIKEVYPKRKDGNYAKDSEIKTMGILFLEKEHPELYDLAQSFLDEMKRYGLFVVPNGELESWLPELKAPGHGNSWLTKKFELMGDDPASNNYILPTTSDVWLFIKEIKEWLASGKHGM